MQYLPADSHGNTKVLKQGRSSKGYGVTDITFYWNYARVRLNKDHANKVFQTQLQIVGLLIPKAVGVSIIGTILGVWNISLIKNGIWVHYNYLRLAINGVLSFQSISKAGWQ